MISNSKKESYYSPDMLVIRFMPNVVLAASSADIEGNDIVNFSEWDGEWS